jgi:hypothetical protein
MKRCPQPFAGSAPELLAARDPQRCATQEPREPHVHRQIEPDDEIGVLEYETPNFPL